MKTSKQRRLYLRLQLRGPLLLSRFILCEFFVRKSTPKSFFFRCVVLCTFGFQGHER